MSNPGSELKDKISFRNRTITVIIAIPIMMVLIWFGSPWLTILAVGWGIGSVNEFYRLIQRSRGVSPLTFFGFLWTLLFIISPYFATIPGTNIPTVPLLLVSAVILPLVILLWRKGKENAFANWAWTVAGILYIGWLLSYFIALRNISQSQPIDLGRGWVFLAIFGTFASDISAYLAGRTLGKHKLAPYISPKKSWEGAIAGVLGAIIISEVIVYLFHLPVSYEGTVVLGILISVSGQLGDLVKSLFKRNMEVKDSGNVLPGHGGFLDRIDSLAFAGVVVYYFVQFIALR